MCARSQTSTSATSAKPKNALRGRVLDGPRPERRRPRDSGFLKRALVVLPAPRDRGGGPGHVRPAASIEPGALSEPR
jgi:hypothetical protein